MYIAIAGNIGAGKTTLTQGLAQRFNWQPVLEEADLNPYLNDFYEDMPRWAFHVQVFFLSSRFRQVKKITGGEGVFIQDRSIFEDALIFARHLYESANMPAVDYTNYMELFNCMTEYLVPPQLLIYLRASTPHLYRNVQKRGRDYEKSIPYSYLDGLNNLYEDWMGNYQAGPLLVLEMEQYDLVGNTSDMDEVARLITQKLPEFPSF